MTKKRIDTVACHGIKCRSIFKMASDIRKRRQSFRIRGKIRNTTYRVPFITNRIHKNMCLCR